MARACRADGREMGKQLSLVNLYEEYHLADLTRRKDNIKTDPK